MHQNLEPKVIAGSFSSDGEEAAARYLETQGLIEILDLAMKQAGHRIAREYPDLARLHQAIRTRKVFSILEFGLGFSTIIMADALLKNSKDWSASGARPKIRNSTPFQLHAVDASKMWMDGRKI